MNFMENSTFWAFLLIALIVGMTLGIAIYGLPAEITGQATVTPMVPGISCNDSDGDINLAVKGHCLDPWGTHTDLCVSEADLVEYWCTNVSCVSKSYNCLDYGYTACQDGACVGGTAMGTPRSGKCESTYSFMPNGCTQDSCSIYCRGKCYAPGVTCSVGASCDEDVCFCECSGMGTTGTGGGGGCHLQWNGQDYDCVKDGGTGETWCPCSGGVMPYGVGGGEAQPTAVIPYGCTYQGVLDMLHNCVVFSTSYPPNRTCDNLCQQANKTCIGGFIRSSNLTLSGLAACNRPVGYNSILDCRCCAPSGNVVGQGSGSQDCHQVVHYNVEPPYVSCESGAAGPGQASCTCGEEASQIW